MNSLFWKPRPQLFGSTRTITQFVFPQGCGLDSFSSFAMNKKKRTWKMIHSNRKRFTHWNNSLQCLLDCMRTLQGNMHAILTRQLILWFDEHLLLLNSSSNSSKMFHDFHLFKGLGQFLIYLDGLTGEGILLASGDIISQDTSSDFYALVVNVGFFFYHFL